MTGSRGQLGHVAPLTSLRFFAALWVLIHHAMPRGTDATSLRMGIGETGWLGVSLFFVLSGFLLSVRYAPRGTMLGARRVFWGERVARLAPTYGLALLFALPLFLRDARVLELTAERTLAVVVSVLTLQQSWWPELACRWNCPAWSLSVEAWFYVAFPFVILALGPWVMRSAIRGGALLVAALAASVALFAWLPPTGADWPIPVHPLSPLVRWPEFLAGIGLAGLVGGWTPPTRRTAHGLLLTGAAWLLTVIVGRETLAAGGWPLLPAALPGFVLLVAGCWATRGHAPGWLDAPSLVLLGEASYALYLFHGPAHSYLLAVVGRVAGPGFDTALPVFLLYLALVVPASVLLYRAFERPWRTRIRARLGLGQPRTQAG